MHLIREIIRISGNVELLKKPILFFGKTDCSNAFRVVPVLLLQRRLLCMKAIHPRMHCVMYFVDKCLSFGASRSCAIFQAFSDALRFIAVHEISTTMLIIEPAITNYLDDFLFIAWSIEVCNGMVRQFLVICGNINCPMSDEKTEWASPLMVFLGVLLDGMHHTLAVPVEKQIKALNLLNYAIENKKVKVKFIQKLTGTLNFLHRVIVPGHAFTRGMYSKLRLTNKQGQILKEHHHINLGATFIQDCQMWKIFLQHAQGSVLCRPFIDFLEDSHSAITLNFTSDASLNPNLGMGAVFDDQWLFAIWPPGFIVNESPSIEYLELYALTAALIAWRHHSKLKNTRVTIWCDNKSVMYMVNKSSTSCEHCLNLIRIITMENIRFNRRLFVRHV